ncbi:Uncharacterised protein [Klebsiella oxytoca]|nr:Uncharacterised protein [Klebsiella oxytoca]SAQ31500.1 Uncharacterised protein [Klebsiella oxytoca]SAQ65369.1 Uncharacterised protein [Klebsiella oxytoca]SBL28988.1 Uncharacterised protein [Klebsiella oxytoca]
MRSLIFVLALIVIVAGICVFMLQDNALKGFSMVRKYLVVIIAAVLVALIVWQWVLDLG